MSLLAQPSGTRIYIEDVGGGWQRELYIIDDEGEGEKVLDVVTVHKKLQRKEQGPGYLISHLTMPVNPVTSATLVPGMSPKTAFELKVATLKASPVPLALLVWAHVQLMGFGEN